MFGVVAVAGAEERRTVVVEARGLADDQPIAGVELRLRWNGGDGRGTTGADGTFRLEYSLPSSGGRGLQVFASRDGLAPLVRSWNGSKKSPEPPDRVVFRMEKAVPIGGRVVDQDGRPLAGASVFLTLGRNYPQAEGQRLSVNFEALKTDADGRWSFAGAPEHLDSVALGVVHPGCLDERTAIHPDPFRDLSALRDGSAVLKLRRGTPVTVTVLGPDGRPAGGVPIA
jgi:hypothetical protein